MTKQQSSGRNLLRIVLWTSVALTVVTHGSILVISPRLQSFALFLPGNAFYLALLAILYFTGHQVLHWVVVFVFLLRGALELYLFAGIETLQIYSNEHQALVPAFSPSASSFLKVVGVLMAISMLGCAAAMALVPSVWAFLAYQRSQRGGWRSTIRKMIS